MHSDRDVSADFVGSEVDKRQVLDSINRHPNPDYCGYAHYHIADSLRQYRSKSIHIEEKYQYEHEQDNILDERLPRSELDSISETAAVGDFVEIGRVEGKESKKDDHEQQGPNCCPASIP